MSNNRAARQCENKKPVQTQSGTHSVCRRRGGVTHLWAKFKSNRVVLELKSVSKSGRETTNAALRGTEVLKVLKR